MKLILAPDAVIRAVNGQLLVHASNGAAPFACESPNLIGWLSQFARPTDRQIALTSVGAADRPQIAQLLNHLQQNGVLIEAAQHHEITPTESLVRTRILLRAMSKMVYDLTADIEGFGEYAEANMRLRGIGVEQQVFGITAALSNLRQQLTALRQPYLHQQAELLGIHGAEQNLQLHIGCGPVKLDGFINIDIAPAPLSMNVLWGLPFDDAQVSIVYLSHLLEHLFFPRDVMALLAEIKRVLCPGGVVRIVVPDIEKCLRAYHTNDQAFFQARREHFSWWPEDATALENFLTYAGVGTEPNYLFESHKYGYDFQTLEKALRTAGFNQIRHCSFQGSARPELRVEHLSEAARWKAGDEYLSLFVEAIR
jgi:predicted SAM-dependent methyltransferase